MDKESIKQEKTGIFSYAFNETAFSKNCSAGRYKKVVEETVSASLSKALKDYNRYFEKD